MTSNKLRGAGIYSLFTIEALYNIHMCVFKVVKERKVRYLSLDTLELARLWKTENVR